MTSLDRKKIEVEHMRVTAARIDMEIKIEEMKQDIDRLIALIQIQIKKELELKTKLGA